MLPRRQYASITFKKNMTGRTCIDCGSTESKDGDKYPHWYNKLEGHQCKICFNRDNIKKKKI